MKNKKMLLIGISGVVLLSLGLLVLLKKDEKEEMKPIEEKEVTLNNEFNIDLIKLVHEKNNYLISPYSIEIALNMMRDGASGETKKELDKVLGNRKINFLSLKDKLSVSNGIFIKDIYKDKIKKSYLDNIKENYDGDILVDKFSTPKLINDWVNQKTNGMIPKILDQLSDDFVLGLANAIALDVKWQSEFECNNTREEKFNLINNQTKSVEMMHETYRNGHAKYLKNDEVTGIILPYEESDNINLEFMAIMPNDLDSYINNLTQDKLNKTLEDFKVIIDDEEVNLSLPRFTYEYEIKNFIDILNKMGINSAFNTSADFSNMIDLNTVYFDTAIHKTKIELNEKGTKAAAVTYFGMKNFMALPAKKQIDIKFNKPFVYMIREANTNEILFWGTVFEPNSWKGSTCNSE